MWGSVFKRLVQLGVTQPSRRGGVGHSAQRGKSPGWKRSKVEDNVVLTRGARFVGERRGGSAIRGERAKSRGGVAMLGRSREWACGARCWATRRSRRRKQAYVGAELGLCAQLGQREGRRAERDTGVGLRAEGTEAGRGKEKTRREKTMG